MVDPIIQSRQLGFQLLSSRETQLVVLAGEGMTDKEIARNLMISPGTVVTLWSRIRAKLAITNRISAISVMIAAIARLSGRFHAGGSGDMTVQDMFGHLTGIRFIANSRRIVLACSQEASDVLELVGGHILPEYAGDGLSFTTVSGESIPAASLPWMSAVNKNHAVASVPIVVCRDGIHETFRVSVLNVEDPILNKVTLVELSPMESESSVTTDLSSAVVDSSGTTATSNGHRV
jgi:DNA-binding CsgD family transcriptional regulator